MYADDANCTFAASDMLALETQINTELKSINLWLRANKFMVITSRQKLHSLNDKTINVNVEGAKINQTDPQSKVLRLNIDENLSWKEHIHAVSKKVASSIGALKRIRPFYFNAYRH